MIGISFSVFAQHQMITCKTKFQRFLAIKMNITLGKGDDDACLPEKLIDAESHTALDETSFNDAVDGNPEVNLEDQGTVAKIVKDHKW